jgi:hypothetical protein
MARRNRDIPIDEEAVRLTAYFLWEQDGRPEGGAERYWFRALKRHMQQEIYDAWLEEDVRDGEGEP